jgi:hypothetical protein
MNSLYSRPPPQYKYNYTNLYICVKQYRTGHVAIRAFAVIVPNHKDVITDVITDVSLLVATHTIAFVIPAPTLGRKYDTKSKSKGTFRKKHIYFKYAETKLILHFNVTPLDFNAPVPAFHMFFNSVRKKFFWLLL